MRLGRLRHFLFTRPDGARLEQCGGGVAVRSGVRLESDLALLLGLRWLLPLLLPLLPLLLLLLLRRRLPLLRSLLRLLLRRSLLSRLPLLPRNGALPLLLLPARGHRPLLLRLPGGPSGRPLCRRVCRRVSGKRLARLAHPVLAHPEASLCELA